MPFKLLTPNKLTDLRIRMIYPL
uniref:Uncharacterized protein n=1 Tax=Arundo donax TaxID=35708 RepID=A0A0A9AYZ1_ARUDO